MSHLILPSDALVLLLGAAGSGKSTLAARLFPPGSIVATDGVRAMLTDDPAHWECSSEAYPIFQAIIDARLKWGRLAVADSTNATAAARAPLLASATRWGRPVHVLALDVPLDLCLDRNRGRERVVPESAVRAQHAAVEDSLAALAAECPKAVIVRNAAGLGSVEPRQGPLAPVRRVREAQRR